MTTQTNQPQTVDQQKIYQASQEALPDANGIIPYLEDEVERFEGEANAFMAGERENAQFTMFRLRQGIYGQRQADVQMIRIKAPGGVLTADALDAMAVVAEEYAPLGKGHVTTRENIQFHHIPLPRVTEVLRLIGSVGLSSREACGNTVRNVVGSPTAGVDPDEVFDPTPYLTAYVRFGVRHPLTQAFPRKFKSAFANTDKRDMVAAAIQDLTYIPQIRVVNGREQRGFKVFVAGGTSIMPRLAKPLYEFLPEDDYLRVALAVWTVFNDAVMLRKNRMMARLKVLVDKIGFDAFKELVEAELKKIGPIDYRPLVAENVRETPPALPPGSTNGYNGSGEYNYWRESNVASQKQQGYYMVYVKLTRGDMTPAQFRGVAEIARKFGGGQVRTTQEQNLLLRWVPGPWLHQVYEALKAIDLAEPGAHEITNVVSCPGTDSCKLGITSSMGLAKAIRNELGSWDGLLQDPEVKKIRIKMSGCPNGCGLHHIANIGFHGAAVKGPDGNQIPSYELFLGGNYGGNRVEDSRIGSRVPKIKVPAKAAPGVVRDIVTFYRENRQGDSESFNQFLDRVGVEKVASIAVKANELVENVEPGSAFYYDWERTNLYKLERGEGECAV